MVSQYRSCGRGGIAHADAAAWLSVSVGLQEARPKSSRAGYPYLSRRSDEFLRQLGWEPQRQGWKRRSGSASDGGQTDCSRRLGLSNPDIRYHPPAIAAVVHPVTVSATYLFKVLEYALCGEVAFRPTTREPLGHLVAWVCVTVRVGVQVCRGDQRPAALGAIVAETKWQPLLASERRGEGDSNDES